MYGKQTKKTKLVCLPFFFLFTFQKLSRKRNKNKKNVSVLIFLFCEKKCLYVGKKKKEIVCFSNALGEKHSFFGWQQGGQTKCFFSHRQHVVFASTLKRKVSKLSKRVETWKEKPICFFFVHCREKRTMNKLCLFFFLTEKLANFPSV